MIFTWANISHFYEKNKPFEDYLIKNNKINIKKKSPKIRRFKMIIH